MTATTSARQLSFLQKVLYADALAAGATGLLLLSASGWLSQWLQLPQPLLFYAGLSFLPYALLVVLVARNAAPKLAAVTAFTMYNALWTAASLLLLIFKWASPNALGAAFVLLQALVIGAFAVLQWLGLKQERQHGRLGTP